MEWEPKHVFIAVVTIAVVALTMLFVPVNLWESVDADEIMVVQAPLSGTLTWHADPGMKWQGFGKVTKYRRRSSYHFEIPVRFNDGGHATMMGSIQYELPLDNKNLTALHTRFGSGEAIEIQLLQTVTNKSVYMSGPLMSSKESMAEKRNALIRQVEDQIENGVYRTIQREVRTKDQMSGADKTVTVVEVARDKDGNPQRQEEAVLHSFGIRQFNFSIEKMPYDPRGEEQITTQQKITMEVQTAIADAKKAEQQAITVAKQGEANAAAARWLQEVEKAKAVTEAQQQFEVAQMEGKRKLEVARLDAHAAAEFKKAETLRGEGEGARRRAVMSADGALEKKLAAWVEVQKAYADAIAKYQGNWVPQVVTGNGGNNAAGSGAHQLIDFLSVKAAQDLALNLRPRASGVASEAR